MGILIELFAPVSSRMSRSVLASALMHLLLLDMLDSRYADDDWLHHRGSLLGIISIITVLVRSAWHYVMALIPAAHILVLVQYPCPSSYGAVQNVMMVGVRIHHSMMTDDL